MILDIHHALGPLEFIGALSLAFVIPAVGAGVRWLARRLPRLRSALDRISSAWETLCNRVDAALAAVKKAALWTVFFAPFVLPFAVLFSFRPGYLAVCGALAALWLPSLWAAIKAGEELKIPLPPPDTNPLNPDPRRPYRGKKGYKNYLTK